MARRRAKKNMKQSASSPGIGLNDAGSRYNEEAIRQQEIEKKEKESRLQEVERQSTAIRAIYEVEIEHLLTGLHLLRSYFNKEWQDTPVLQFFSENLPNLSIVRDEKDGQFKVHWKDKDGNVSMSRADQSIDASLLHRLSTAYPDRFATTSTAGIEFSSLQCADSLQMRVLEELSETQMFGLQDGLQTPGVTSGKISVGMTPKTLRLPKLGEMLVSVHGSPLGVYKKDNMKAINESEEG